MGTACLLDAVRTFVLVKQADCILRKNTAANQAAVFY